MDEVTIPLALLVIGLTAILWEMVRGERSRPHDAHGGSVTGAPEPRGETDKTEAAAER